MILDGRALSEAMLAGLAAEVGARGRPEITLVAVLVDPDERAEFQLRLKRDAGERVGVRVCACRLSARDGQTNIEAAVDELAADPLVHGIFVHLPLPSTLDEQAVLGRVPQGKDADATSSTSVVVAQAGVEAVRLLLDHNGVDLRGARVRLEGCPPYLTRSLPLLLTGRGATVADDGDVVLDLSQPGGIGPATVAVLLERTARLAFESEAGR